jgi:hypothetical protein
MMEFPFGLFGDRIFITHTLSRFACALASIILEVAASHIQALLRGHDKPCFYVDHGLPVAGFWMQNPMVQCADADPAVGSQAPLILWRCHADL